MIQFWVNSVPWIVHYLRGMVLAAVLCVNSAQAETLADALVAAYENSNLLEQRRALLRAADEDVSQAYATLQPIINFVSQANAFGPNQNNDTGEHWSGSLAISAELTIFDNGVTRLAAEAAKETVLGLRAALIQVEQQVLLEAVRVFMEVIRATQFVSLRNSNLELIAEELRATKESFDAGALTQTDVSIVEARLSAARGNLVAAEGDLLIARESYKSVIGSYPGDPKLPAAPPATASSEEAAKHAAVRGHPRIEEAQRNVNAADATARRARAALGLTVSTGLNLSIDERSRHSYSANLRARVPLFRGGSLSALRQLEINREAARSALLQSVIDVELGAGTAWARLQVSTARADASRRQITASQLAYDGTRQEARFGSRSPLDVLNAEQELLEARSSLISAEIEQHVSGYSLLSAMGVLTVKDLELGIVTYDPADYYNQVNSRRGPAEAKSERGRDLDRVLEALGKR